MAEKELVWAKIIFHLNIKVDDLASLNGSYYRQLCDQINAASNVKYSKHNCRLKFILNKLN